MIKLLKILYYKYLQIIKPIKYVDKIGVKHGDNLNIYGKVSFGSEPWIITLGNNVYLTNNCQFITHDGGVLIFRKEVPDLEITKPITVGNDVYMGMNVTIMPGVHIGNRVVIGTGAIVTKDIPDNSVAAGIPAKVIKTADEYFEKIQKESLHLGHLRGKEKDSALKKYYSYKS